MAVTCSKAIKRHFRLVFQNSYKVYGHERACSTIIKKSINLYNFHINSSRSFYNSAINKYFAISKPEKAMGALSPLDPSSFSRPEIAVIKHISLILDVDFENKVLTGSADLNFDILQATDEIILDVNNLTIQSVELNDGTELKYKIDEHIPNFGSKLSITLPHLSNTGKSTLKLVQLKESETEAKQNCMKIEKSTSTLILDFADDMYKPNMSNYKDHKVCNSNASKPKEKNCKSDIVKHKVSEPEVKENVDDICIPYLNQNTKDICKPVSDNKDKCKPYLSKQEDNCTSNINKPLEICKPYIDKNKEDIIKPYMAKCNKNICNSKQVESFKNDEEFGHFLVGHSQNLCHPKKINRNMGLSWWNTKLAKLKKEVDRRKRRIRNARPDRRELVIRHYLDFKEQYKQEIKNAQASSWENLNIFTPDRRANKRLVLRIKYKTSPSASALQWLEPNQTSGKKHPYMFSQCQPIHARSILPCQDTPAVKFTYDAEVTAPEEFTVLMSAVRGENLRKNTKFQQTVPIPSYLLAIAVGVLEHRRLGPRSLVWSEKEEIERSAWEFADTEKYLKAAENLCGPYQWGQYDLLVLPPSFPYGGMENPCLTFVTPTLLAGDRSQADVIVHEIMHSWTGNLVTNKNFEHFWLNEGFTVFLERKVGASLIADPVEAKRSRDFHSLLGLQELGEAINDNFGPTSPFTRLVQDLNGVHPDDAFSRVPYEKGSLFLRYLEDLVGGAEVFDGFLRSYLGKFQKRSLDTEEFKQYFLDYFSDNKNLTTVDWDAWFFSSGMPPIIPDYDTSMTKAVTALVTKIKEQYQFSYDDVKNFTPHQMINLLQELIDRDPLPVDKLRTLGDIYKINDSKNTEIIYRWVRLCIRSRDDTKLNEAFNFVNRQGRMKYVRPIYRDLYAWEAVRQQAIDNFLKNEPYMMHVSAYTVRKDLHLSK